MFHEAYGGVPDARADALDAASARFRTRHLPALLLPGARRRYAPELDWYRRDLVALYEAAASVAGAGVVVDSSKFPSHLFALLQAGSLDVRVAHLVRDPRAVAYSWQRDKADPDAPGGRMPRLHPAATGLYWSAWNLATERIARTARVPYLRLRYEDLVTDPGGTLRAVLDLAGVPVAAPPVTAAGEITLGVSHQVSGNPIRFDQGRVVIRDDDAWRRDMKPSHRRLAATVTAPLRARYGYTSPGTRQPATTGGRQPDTRADHA